MAKLKHDATVGRILLIDANNPPDFTAEEFLSYIAEGFVPISYGYTNSNTGYALCTWKDPNEDGAISVSAGGRPLATFYSAQAIAP